MTVDDRWLLDYYISAKESLIESGYAWEIDEVDWLRRDLMSELDFLREAAWVVLCSGFRERVVARAFIAVSEAFLRWESADEIARQGDACVQAASHAFANDRKLRAIVRIAERVAAIGADGIRSMDDAALLGFLCWPARDWTYHSAASGKERRGKRGQARSAPRPHRRNLRFR